ncbi:MAG: hypothetical protein KIT46_09080 [Anaerolineales bacterium]|nr:hypothetical protein [Anaerolineales bacterium]HRN51125.1 hypothetical protein [Anaerolineales bacterium]
MRKPRPSAFDPTYKEHPAPKPETVDLGDAVPIQPKSPLIKKAQPPAPEVKNPSDHDTVIPRYQDTTVESIRKAVKQFGKEAATHRFTRDEKQKIAELIFTYSGNGIRTSENEIARIAVNFLIEDHRRNGKDSILDQVLKLLNS